MTLLLAALTAGVGLSAWIVLAAAPQLDVQSTDLRFDRTSHDASNSLSAALAAGQPVRIVGLGSSVGVGATLPDPETQSPVGRFAALLRRAHPDSDVVAENLSVDGSVAVDGLAVYRAQVHLMAPTALVVAFGMNDGMPGAFNSGETFPGGVEALRVLVLEAQADGVTVVLLTTPSPHTTRTNWAIPEGMPITYVEADGREMPGTTTSVVAVDGVPFSIRHAEFNIAVRALADQTGALLGDAATYWTSAVAARGQDALFDANEFAHPNLAGHQASYWAALDLVVASLDD